MIEEFDAVYYSPVQAVEQRIRDELVDGRRHIYEAEMKERRRAVGAEGHEAQPRTAHDPGVATDGNAVASEARDGD